MTVPSIEFGLDMCYHTVCGSSRMMRIDCELAVILEKSVSSVPGSGVVRGRGEAAARDDGAGLPRGAGRHSTCSGGIPGAGAEGQRDACSKSMQEAAANRNPAFCPVLMILAIFPWFNCSLGSRPTINMRGGSPRVRGRPRGRPAGAARVRVRRDTTTEFVHSGVDRPLLPEAPNATR